MYHSFFGLIISINTKKCKTTDPQHQLNTVRNQLGPTYCECILNINFLKINQIFVINRGVRCYGVSFCHFFFLQRRSLIKQLLPVLFIRTEAKDLFSLAPL